MNIFIGFIEEQGLIKNILFSINPCSHLSFEETLEIIQGGDMGRESGTHVVSYPQSKERKKIVSMRFLFMPQKALGHSFVFNIGILNKETPPIRWYVPQGWELGRAVEYVNNLSFSQILSLEMEKIPGVYNVHRDVKPSDFAGHTPVIIDII